MRTLYAGNLHVSYSQFYLMTDMWSSDDMQAVFAGQANGLCGAGLAGGLWLITGLHTGSVPVAVEEHDIAPPVEAGWQEIVEVSCVFGAPSAFLGWDSGAMIDVPTGPLRVRYSATRMDEARAADVRGEDEPNLDRYLLQMWPAPPAPDAVLRQTSQIAAYWHDVARSGPSAAQVAARRRAHDTERREQHRIERARADARRAALHDRQVWGGPRPPEPLGAILAAAPVAKLELALAGELARLGPDACRGVTRWAARVALAEAGLDTLPWIAEALEALDAGRPLPPPFDDTRRASERMWRDVGVAHRAVTSPDGAHGNLSQQAMGFHALITATQQDDPVVALFSAVHHAQLTYGRDRLPVLHDALRALLAAPERLV